MDLSYDPKWHELFAILYFLSKIMQVPGRSIYYRSIYENSDRLRFVILPKHESSLCDWIYIFISTNHICVCVTFWILYYMYMHLFFNFSGCPNGRQCVTKTNTVCSSHTDNKDCYCVPGNIFIYYYNRQLTIDHIYWC